MSLALLARQVIVQVFNFWVANAVGCRAVGIAVLEAGTLALCNFNKGLVANVHAINLDAAAVLPGVPNL